MPETAWHASLADSVRALGAAADELRTAHQHAQLTARTTDPARIIPLPGTLTVPGAAEPVRPHEDALWQLSDLYMVLEHHTRELYENAALGYAVGTARAVRAVLSSQRPRHVELTRERNGAYVLDLDDLPNLAQSLTVQAGARDLARLRTELLACWHAQDSEGNEETADEPGGQPSALADAAHAYGTCAERALHHLIRFADARGFLHAV
ncbi:hypothetical protein [Actinacidiphila guanduensis]|uniref:Uncharacterized protein n=1 Tax=Actinacidiphila guanduensis TaxID=310781 RepID=A0A1G9XSU1_9ACTN|nr:hypothetical protein [Actinacidiphila guanduensis]SDM99476.1 hypothetical protein SAMN05216259_102253 [Actinacidiphila guanduensis]